MSYSLLPLCMFGSRLFKFWESNYFQLCLKFKFSYIIQGEEINFKLNLRNLPNTVIKI